MSRPLRSSFRQQFCHDLPRHLDLRDKLPREQHRQQVARRLVQLEQRVELADPDRSLYLRVEGLRARGFRYLGALTACIGTWASSENA